MKQIEYKKKKFNIFDNTYLPADDTYLLLDNLKVNKGDYVLDLGTGCGILGIIAAEYASKVVLTDISPIAIDCALNNIKLNNLLNKIEVRTGNLFEPIKNNEQFNLILFNPPYLPITDKDRKPGWLEKAWDGGKNGRKIIDQFLVKFNDHLKENGRVQMIQTSLSNYEKTFDFLKKQGFAVKIEAKKKFPFEIITLITIQKSPHP